MPKGKYKRTEKGRENMSLSHKKSIESLKHMRSLAFSQRGVFLTEIHKRNIREGLLRVSHKKSRNVLKGDKHYNWKGGITPENKRIRNSLEYRLWRNSVFQRDKFTCLDCGLKSGEGKAIVLNADHIKSFAFFPELRFALDNGRTLCVECHKSTDNYAGKGRNVIPNKKKK